jgi:hypothetical protein
LEKVKLLLFITTSRGRGWLLLYAFINREEVICRYILQPMEAAAIVGTMTRDKEIVAVAVC